jgi:NADH dehydrogenase
MANKRIVVLGAGYGGLAAAKTLHKKLKKQDVEIILIDQNDHHTLLTELHEVAGHRVEPSGVQVSIQHVLEYTKANFVQDLITKADLKEKKLYSEKNTYSFDYLVLGVGSEPAYFGIPGIQENGYTLWSLDDAKIIHKHILDMFEKASNEKDPQVRSELLTFVVGGGGFTGIEMLGELMEWTKALCKEYNISYNEVKLVVVEALPTILPILNEKLIKKSVRYMEKKGVEVLTNSPITDVQPDSVTIKGGKVIRTRTLIWTGGIQTKSFVKELGITLGKRNRIVVNDYLQTVEYPYVYAIGDNMEFKEDGEVLPPLVETALQSGHCAAENIAADILGKEKKKLKAKLHGVMVSIGSLYGVAEIKGMPLLSGFLAILMKHLVNLHYLFEIGGLELCWDYLNHQFFHTQRKYNFILQSVIGHARERSFKFWLVPLRIFLGLAWLYSGLKKVDDGWLTAWEMIGPGGADATSSASVMSLISDHTPDWYAWIVETFIYPNALFFQKVIVITEIGLGLAFIFGLFTFIAAIVSIGMNINFMLSTGLPVLESDLKDYWFITASIAMLAGAGRVLGVDYYLMPWLTRQLRYFQRNKGIHFLKGWKW